MANKRTIVRNGVPEKVSLRDYGLWTMVEAGTITEGEMARFQEEIPEGASIKEARRLAQELKFPTTAEVTDPTDEDSEVLEGDGRLDTAENLTDGQRLEIYMSIAVMALEDINDVPMEYLQTYAYGATRDTAARALIDEMPEDEGEVFRRLMSPQRLYEEAMAYQFHIEDTQGEIGTTGVTQLVNTEDRLPTEVMRKFEVMQGTPDAENEPVWDAGVMALSTILTGGVAAAVGAPALFQTAAGAPGSLPRVLALAGKITGKAPTAFKWGKRVAYGGSAVSLGTGTPALIARILEQGSMSVEEVENLQSGLDRVMPGFEPNAFAYPFSKDDPLGFAYRSAVYGTVRGGVPTVQPPSNLTGIPSGAEAEVLAAGSPYDRPGAPEAPLGATMRDSLDQPSEWKNEDPVTEVAKAKAEAIDEQEQAEKAFAEDPFVGIADMGYRSEKDLTRGMGGGWRQGPEGGLTGGTTPMYHDSDVDKVFSRMTPAQLIQFQDRMIRARLIAVDASPSRQPHFPGVAGFQTVEAMKYVMELANREGKHYLLMAEQMAQVGDERTAADDAADAAAKALADRVRIDPYVPQAYLAPDQATLRGSIRENAERELGRKMNPWELTLLADQMLADDRANYELSEDARKDQYRGKVDAFKGGALYEPVEVEIDFDDEAIDAEARMVEQFQKMFKGEIARKERTESVSANTQNFFAGVRNAEDAIGGR